MNNTVLIFLKVLTLIFLVSPVTGQVYETRGQITPVFGAFWNMDIAGSASQTNDRFGQALAEGDFNGDGRQDLAIGMPGRDVFGNDEGMVIVLYGATGSLSSDNSSILFSTDIQNDQNFATSLTSGDFNNDGFDDLVVGTPNKDYINPQTSIVAERTGAVYIHYGSSTGLPTTGLFIDANSDDVSVQDRQSFAEFGRALTTADFNNDGFDDLVVSAPNHDLSDQNNVLRDNAGMVFVYYGGQQTSGNMGISHMVRDRFHQNTAGIIGAVEENDFFGYSLGAGDFNNDGFQDLYITNYGPNKMLFNNGDGTFKDVTTTSGTADDLWGTSAAAFDFDRDGLLDLYLANYVYFDVAVNKKCYANNSRRDYCGPSAFDSQPDRFFHNRGDGTFEDVTSKILIDYTPGSGLGVVSLDVNNDGWLDLYVANDGQANQLWINQQGNDFIEDGLFSGSAVNQNGQAEASMGLAAGDFDNDGDEDLFMTHIMGETNTLYINDGEGMFEDKTIAAGLAAMSFPFTAFGVNWVDYDNDGWLDLFIGNGAVLEIDKLALMKDPYPLHEPNQLLANREVKKFIDISEQLGEASSL